MRLIDADEFLKKFSYTDADSEESKTWVCTIRRMIKEQPTAYDVDKLRRPEDMTAEEAWEIAGKIILHPDIGGYTNSELEKIFGNCSKIAIFRDGTPQQAKAKIKAWETENEIKVGDIVHSIDRPGIEVMITARHKSGCYDGINAGGATHSGINIKYWKKTGRHIDIQSMLKQIGGTE